MENNLHCNIKLHHTPGYKIVNDWFVSQGMKPFAFQEDAWEHIINKRSGLVNAPTGCGKTFSVFLGAVIDFLNNNGDDYTKKKRNGLQLLWVTPLRALAKDIGRAMEEVIAGLRMQWQIGSRNGDTPISERQKQKRQMPEVLIITPESMQLLLAQKDHADFFSSLKIIAVDEWHELLGSKRGVQVELAISRIIGIKKTEISLWGISATIGNLEQAREVLLSPLKLMDKNHQGVLVRANIAKPIEVISVFPDEIEKYPWAGHL